MVIDLRSNFRGVRQCSLITGKGRCRPVGTADAGAACRCGGADIIALNAVTAEPSPPGPYVGRDGGATRGGGNKKARLAAGFQEFSGISWRIECSTLVCLWDLE